MNTASDSAQATAHGKIILFGEHAVVHGADALAMAIDQGITVSAARHDGPTMLTADPWGYKVDATSDTPGSLALGAILHQLDLEPTGFSLHAQCDLPGQSGLGASAALGAATTRALCTLFDLQLTDQQLFECVQASEAIFHGNPSGIDAQLALFGGTVVFNKQRPPRFIEAGTLRFTVVHSGRAGNTASTVKAFREKLTQDPQGSAHLEEIQNIVDQAVAAVEDASLSQLGSLMNRNHELLAWFGISTDRLDAICSLAGQSGALGAKLTGGGGGGCAIVLETTGSLRATDTLRDAGYQIIVP